MAYTGKDGKIYYDNSREEVNLNPKSGSAVSGVMLGNAQGWVGLMVIALIAIVFGLAAPLALLIWFYFYGYKIKFLRPTNMSNFYLKYYRSSSLVVAAIYIFTIVKLFMGGAKLDAIWPVVTIFGVIALAITLLPLTLKNLNFGFQIMRFILKTKIMRFILKTAAVLVGLFFLIIALYYIGKN
ncbi:hypothetical protein MLC35_10285 [Sulfurimonas sp. NW7]|uniref:hypothetical protein n=1 Tax=Sulfurimonas sp. NW7 TaxID=2922727 RepID=UPI003DA8FF64